MTALGSNSYASHQSDVDQLRRQTLKFGWISSMEQSANGPETAGLVIQPFLAITKDVFIWTMGPQHNENPLIALEAVCDNVLYKLTLTLKMHSTLFWSEEGKCTFRRELSSWLEQDDIKFHGLFHVTCLSTQNSPNDNPSYKHTGTYTMGSLDNKNCLHLLNVAINDNVL